MTRHTRKIKRNCAISKKHTQYKKVHLNGMDNLHMILQSTYRDTFSSLQRTQHTTGLTKWSKLPANFLSVFDHFVGLDHTSNS